MNRRRFRKGPPAFLKTEEAAFRWAIRNVDTNTSRDELRNLAMTYSDFAFDAYHTGVITIYRAVRVPVINGVAEVNMFCLGKAWSAEQRGAGVYGSVPHQEGNLADVIIEGRVLPEHVDWEYGYTSFVYYGESQWEVSLLEDSPVEVLRINGIELSPPLEGSTGPAGEQWSRTCGKQA